MNKHVYFASVALFVLTLGFLLTDALVWQPGVTRANVRRIRPGMTLAEVEAILGRPPESRWRERRLHFWFADHGFTVVFLDGHGQVSWARWCLNDGADGADW